MPTKSLGVGEVAKGQGVNEYDGEFWVPFEGTTQPVVPLVVSTGGLSDWPMLPLNPKRPPLAARRYYFGFFGYVAKLPYKRSVPAHIPGWVEMPASECERILRAGIDWRSRQTGGAG